MLKMQFQSTIFYGSRLKGEALIGLFQRAAFGCFDKHGKEFASPENSS
jgi:hypothetical protein